MKSFNGANFPLLNSNVYVTRRQRRDDQPYSEPIMKEKTFVDPDGKKQTVRIGYIALFRHIMTWDKTI